MKQKFLLFILFFSFWGDPAVFADKELIDLRTRYEITAGTVEDLSRNTIKLFDETDKRSRNFIYVGRTNNLHKGDRI